MNKKELIREIQDETGFTQKSIDETLKAFMAVVTKQVIEYKDVSLVGFGTFTVSHRNERKQINPRTKQFITVPAKNVPVFKFSDVIKKQVSRENNGF
jgi:DNA-binding protein HU-beta